jgi:hypothetical protein
VKVSTDAGRLNRPIRRLSSPRRAPARRGRGITQPTAYQVYWDRRGLLANGMVGLRFSPFSLEFCSLSRGSLVSTRCSGSRPESKNAKGLGVRGRRRPRKAAGAAAMARGAKAPWYRQKVDIDDVVPNERQPRLGPKEDEELQRQIQANEGPVRAVAGRASPRDRMQISNHRRRAALDELGQACRTRPGSIANSRPHPCARGSLQPGTSLPALLRGSSLPNSRCDPT